MEAINKPSDYGLEHETWRPHQYETLTWAEQLQVSGILEAPTGSGKTALPRALSHNEKVISLVQHKQLQQLNYGTKYDFDVLYGKNAYECIHPLNRDPNDSLITMGADSCLYEIDMTKCEYYDECPYIIARETAKSSYKASLNYAYWFRAKWLKKHNFSYLVCDEGHNLSDQVLEFTGCTIDEYKRAKYELPTFPQANRVDEVALWIPRAVAKLDTLVGSVYQPKERERIKRLSSKLADTYEAISINSKDWFVRSGSVGQRNPQLVVRPLTARYHFNRYFLSHRYRLIMMSATIGDAETFTKELGMNDGDWDLRVVPSLWDARVRPVLVPDDCPKMNYRSTPQEKTKQALIIAREIKKVPEDWCGVIHVNSKQQARDLAGLLARFGLGGRVWIPDEKASTEQVMKDWQMRKQKVSGSLAIAWAWWEGVDLTEERICIVAKVPFPSLGDEYENERLHYDGGFYLQRTAWNVEQGLGRSRRGEAEDYDLNGDRTQLVMIADGNWNRVKKYLSKNLKESIVMI